MTFRITPVHEEQYLLGDVGVLIVAYALREGLFRDYKTLEELLAGDDVHIRFHDHVLDLPVFCASIPKGTGLDHNAPMRYPAQRAFMIKVCGAAGFPRECIRGKDEAWLTGRGSFLLEDQ